jgi:type I restriction enzyme S subunit
MAQYKKYENYEDSGVEWIGTIPNEWAVTRVGNAFEVTLGKMLQPNQNSQNDVMVSYLKAMNIQEGYIKEDKIDEMYATEKELESLNLMYGDVLVCEGGDVARSAILKSNFENTIFQNSLHRVRSTNKGNNLYLHYLLNVIRNSGYLDILVNKATIAHFTKEKFNSLRICLPTIYEQIQISNYLDQKTFEIDSLIADKEKLIVLLEEQRQAIISETVTRGLDPNVSMKDSGVEWIGEIPVEWELKKIKYTTYVKGRIGWQGLRSDEFIDEGPYLVTGTDFINGVVNWDTCYHISEERYYEAPPIQLKEGDLLITKDGTIGKIAIVKNKPDKSILNSGIFVTRILKREYITEYMYYILNSRIFERYIKYMELGSTIKHLYQETFNNFTYPTPGLQEQLKIVEYLELKIMEIDRLIDDINKQIQKLKEYRQSLTFEVATGKIDVRDIAVDEGVTVSTAKG